MLERRGALVPPCSWEPRRHESRSGGRRERREETEGEELKRGGGGRERKEREEGLLGSCLPFVDVVRRREGVHSFLFDVGTGS